MKQWEVGLACLLGGQQPEVLEDYTIGRQYLLQPVSRPLPLGADNLSFLCHNTLVLSSRFSPASQETLEDKDWVSRAQHRILFRRRCFRALETSSNKAQGST